jgi:hypothetical protein
LEYLHEPLHPAAVDSGRCCAMQQIEQAALGDQYLSAALARAGMVAQGRIERGVVPSIEDGVKSCFKLVATHGRIP